ECQNRRPVSWRRGRSVGFLVRGGRASPLDNKPATLQSWRSRPCARRDFYRQTRRVPFPYPRLPSSSSTALGRLGRPATDRTTPGQISPCPSASRGLRPLLLER